MVRLEREIEEEFRDKMRARLEERVAEVGASLSGTAPRCSRCEGRAMKSRGRKASTFLTRFGKTTLRMPIYVCKTCGERCHPWRDALGIEPGRVSGAFARLLALLGVVVPYDMAARLALVFFGVEVSPMCVWRCVQRLGDACEKYTEQMAQHHADARSDIPEPASAPDVVVTGVDGCALGMQVRGRRRRRTRPDEVLPPLPAVEEGHFREVKTGVLLLPSERVESSPGRRSVVRRKLVTCLGHADQVFERLWSKLLDLGWLGPRTVVVVVGDGAEWIWNRAKMFARRCEILDFWHVVEKAWEFARLRHGQGTTLAEQWIGRIAESLRAGHVERVIEELRGIEPSTPDERDKLEGLIRYYTGEPGTHALRRVYTSGLRHRQRRGGERAQAGHARTHASGGDALVRSGRASAPGASDPAVERLVVRARPAHGAAHRRVAPNPLARRVRLRHRGAMKRRRTPTLPADLRPRLEAARLEALALFRAMDRLDLTADEIPQDLIHELFELDADFAEALWALDQPPGRLDQNAVVRDTLASLHDWPIATEEFRQRLPARAQRPFADQIATVRPTLTHRDAYSGVPGRDPEAEGPPDW
jgi:hypothetical protein